MVRRDLIIILIVVVVFVVELLIYTYHVGVLLIFLFSCMLCTKNRYFISFSILFLFKEHNIMLKFDKEA